ncbi:MAG: glycosyltransferase [Cyclobacteriaceae bacterium]
MTNKENIVCISMTTWEGDYMKTIVHMMGRLAKTNQVLFVDYGFTWKDLIYTILGKTKAPIARMLGFEPRLRTVLYKDNEVNHLTLPALLPINWIKNAGLHDYLLRLQMKWISRYINKATNQLSMHEYVLINAFNPIYGVGLNGLLIEKRCIYYCYDEISEAKWGRNHGGRLEHQFLQIVDQIVVTSSELRRTKSFLHSNVTLIENGVDFNFFHSSYPRLKINKRGVIGYLGSLDDRIDFELLEELCGTMTNFDFLFVGRIQSTKSHRLERYHNTKLLGSVEIESIPKWLGQMDYGIIPFLCNTFNRNIYPLKINEYFAAGLPVISTPFSNLASFGNLVTVADKASEFEQAIMANIKYQNKIERNRIAFARQNDWSDRINKFNQLLND